MSSVLVIDDDPIYFEVATALLRSTGAAQVTPAPDGKQARRELDENGPFDLLLLDLNMPDYDGVEFLEYLRTISFSAPIIICSAAHASVLESAAHLAKAYGLNIAAVIEKPLTLQKLAPVIDQI